MGQIRKNTNISGNVNKLTQIETVEGNIIQNIVIVGRFLDFAQSEGLIPETAVCANFKNVTSALEKTFDKPLGNELSSATATVGKMLEDVLSILTPNEPFTIITYRDLIRRIPELVIPKLRDYGYWDPFYEFVERVTIHWEERSEDRTACQGAWPKAEVIWLTSLQNLWEKHFNRKKLYGLAAFDLFAYKKVKQNRETTGKRRLGHPDFMFILKTDDAIIGAYKAEFFKWDRESDFGKMNRLEFRVFFTGLVLDLIRVGTELVIDLNFWESLVSSLKIN